MPTAPTITEVNRPAHSGSAAPGTVSELTSACSGLPSRSGLSNPGSSRTRCDQNRCSDSSMKMGRLVNRYVRTAKNATSNRRKPAGARERRPVTGTLSQKSRGPTRSGVVWRAALERLEADPGSRRAGQERLHFQGVVKLPDGAGGLLQVLALLRHEERVGHAQPLAVVGAALVG